MEQPNNFENLTEEQKNDVITFTTITETDNIEQAIHYLGMCNYDLNNAVSMFMEHGTLEQNPYNQLQQLQQQQQQQQQQQHQQNFEQQQQQQIDFDQINQQLNQQSQNSIVEKYKKHIQEKQENQNWIIQRLLQSVTRGIQHGIKSTWNLIIPTSLRGYSSSGEEFIETIQEKFESIDTYQFNIGTFDENLESADNIKRPLLVFIHMNNEIFQELEKKLLTNRSLINLINKEFHVFGIVGTSEDSQKITEFVPSQNFPCFALFRKNLFDQTDLIDFVTINSQNQDPSHYIERLNQAIQNYYLIISEEEQIKQEATRVNQQQRRHTMPNPNDLWNPFVEQNQEFQQFQQQNTQRQQEEYQKIERDRQLRQEQELKFKEAQLMAQEQQNKKEKEQEELLQKQQNEEQELQKIIEQKRQRKLSLPEEPNEDDQDVLKFIFRLPDGNRINRIFKATDKIELLFFYIESYEQLEFENPNSKFDLIQTYPQLSLIDKQEQQVKEVFEDSNQETLMVKEFQE